VKDDWQGRISGNSTAAAARKGLSPTKDGAVPSVKDVDAKDGFMLLQMAGKGDVANIKKVIALLKMVLLILPLMAGNGTDAPAEKGVAPAQDGAIAAARNDWQQCCCGY